MAKGEILYIEDNFHNRRIVRKILERQDYVIYDAEDGLEGYNRLKELMPKVVLLDISLPTMDGIEIANRVKADAETRDVVLIALTASAMAGDRERFLEAGCDDYLSKPFRALDLVEMVDFYMSPDFVPGKTHSPGSELNLGSDSEIKPIAPVEKLPKPDLERKTKPKSEVMAETPAKPAKPASKPAPEPKAEQAKSTPKPKAEPKAEQADLPTSNGHGAAAPVEPKSPQAASADKSQGELDSKINSGLNDMFGSIRPADPNKDEGK